MSGEILRRRFFRIRVMIGIGDIISCFLYSVIVWGKLRWDFGFILIDYSDEGMLCEGWEKIYFTFVFVKLINVFKVVIFFAGNFGYYFSKLI